MKGSALLKHLTETLPDSIMQRKELLRDALAIFPDGEHRVAIALILRALEQHEQEVTRLQAELPFLDVSTDGNKQ